MRRSKGYTDELEKINRDDSGIALNIKLKKAAAKKLRFRITGFSQNYNILKADTKKRGEVFLETFLNLFIT